LALLEDLFKINPVTGVVVGIGVVLLGPVVLPVVGQILRPAVKVTIKGGLVLYDQMAEIGEVAGDLFAEAHAELVATEPTAAAGAEQHSLTPPAGPARRRRQKSST
jgi:Protein of unknown function (DUF5132)